MSEWAADELKKTTIFACEPQPIVVEGLRRVLERTEDLAVSGEGRNAGDCLEEIGAGKPSIVLLDHPAGAKATFDYVPQIRGRSSETHVVIWVTQINEVESFRALQIGARGILRKTMPAGSILDCLRAVSQGNIWIENSISNQVVGFLNRRNLPRLTPREQEIVALISRGMKNRQIADALSITTGTVKVHLMHIFEKTGVKDRYELAMEAPKLVGSESFEESALSARRT